MKDKEARRTTDKLAREVQQLGQALNEIHWLRNLQIHNCPKCKCETIQLYSMVVFANNWYKYKCLVCGSKIKCEARCVVVKESR